jgi:hypothetical protein
MRRRQKIASLRKHGSGALDHQPAPPNDSGIPLRRSHALFFGKLIADVREKPKKLANIDLLMIVIALFISMAILLVPYD